MKKKTELQSLLFSALLFLLFTLAVMIIDVQPIGPQGSQVGFAFLNGAFFSVFGENAFWYTLTEILGYFAILFGGCLGILFLLQWWKRKSIRKVDQCLWSFGFLMLLVIIAYLFFEMFVVNCRPVLTDGELEASYPSSHTMLVVSVFSFLLLHIGEYVQTKKLVGILRVSFFALILLIVIGRLFSGVHWFTDIVGSLLLCCFIFSLHKALSPILDRICQS